MDNRAAAPVVEFVAAQRRMIAIMQAWVVLENIVGSWTPIIFAQRSI
jgi:hypothetical protein